MNFLIRQAHIINPGSAFHGLQKDILINNGIIEDLGDDLSTSGARPISLPNLHVSPGWMDSFSLFGEPGFEYRETLASGCAAAAAGGFTDILILPNTRPPIASRSQVEFLLGRSTPLPVTLHPTASISRENSGRELSEMYDLHEAGAAAFTDGTSPLQDSGLLLKALQYVKAINGLIVQLPDDKSIQPDGLMHEGVMSTRLGLPGRSALSEEMMVSKCIDLLRYTGSRLHISGISTSGSVQMIRRAKIEGLDISCSVTPYHLFFTDQDLANYNTSFKLTPPLRSREDIDSLKGGLTDGTIDCIASHHTPLHIDEKICEFERALPGMGGLESCFGAANSIIRDVVQLVKIMYENPRKILGLPIPKIEKGSPACLSLFDPDIQFRFEENMIRSSSRNYGFLGKELRGKVYGIINKGQLTLNS